MNYFTSLSRTASVFIALLASALILNGVRSVQAEATGSCNNTVYGDKSGFATAAPQFYFSNNGIDIGFANPNSSAGPNYYFEGHVDYYDSNNNLVWESTNSGYQPNDTGESWDGSAPDTISWSTAVAWGTEQPADQNDNAINGQTVVNNAESDC